MKKTKTKIRISKKWILLFVILLFIVSATAYAAPAPVGGGMTTEATDAFNTILKNLSAVLVTTIKMLSKFLWPIFLAIGGLLNNDILFGGGMEERLLGIWVQVRNFVNMGFVVILVGIALYNVTGFAKDQYEIKKFIGKFVIALLAVNFSYIGLKVMLDVGNVLTIALFAVPASINSEQYSTGIATCPSVGTGDCKQLTNADNANVDNAVVDKMVKSICTNLYGASDSFKTSGAMDKADWEKNSFCKLVGANQYTLTAEGAKFFGSFSSNNAAIVLAMQLMNVVDIDKVSEAINTKTVDFASLTRNLMFSVLLYVVYGTSYIALFIVLLVRLVILWIILAISPVIALTLIFPKIAEGGGDLKDKFIQSVLAPVKIAAILSIGYMMLSAWKAMPNAKIPLTGFTMKSLNFELSGISHLQAFIVAFAAVAVVWIGVFAAAGKVTKLTDSIKGAMQGFGKRLVNLYKFAPLVPTEEGRKSIMQVYRKGMMPIEEIERRGRGDEYGGAMTESEMKNIARGPGLNVAKATGVLQRGGVATPSRAKIAGGMLARMEREGGEEGKQFVRRVTENLTPGERAQFLRTGKLSAEGLRTVQRNIAALPMVAGGAAAGAAGKPAPTKPGKGGKPKPPTPEEAKTAERKELNANDNAVTIAKRDNNAAWNSLSDGEKNKLSALRDRYDKAQTITDPVKKEEELKAIEAEYKKDDVKKAVTTIRAAQESKTEINAVGTTAKAVKDTGKKLGDIQTGTPEAAKKKELTDALEKAKKQLDSKKVPGENIKKILEDQLKKAGFNIDDIKKDNDLKGYVTP